MRRILVIALAALLGAAGPASPARAGDCAGMDDYNYDHGECTDASSDTSGLMRDMYHASDRLAEARADRYRSSVERGYNSGYVPRGGRGDDGRAERHAYAASIVRAMTYLPSPAVTTHVLVALNATGSTAERRANVATMRRRLAAFPLLERALGLPPNQVSSAAYALVLEAYRHYDGETLVDGLGSPTWLAISEALAPRFAALGNERRQEAADTLATYAMVLEVDGRTGSRAQLRTAARKLLALVGIDPARERLDRIMCHEASAGTDCAASQWYASNGRVGRDPLAEMRGGP